MTQVEIKMVLNTKSGQMNLDFFTSVEGVFLSEDDVMDKISSIMEMLYFLWCRHYPDRTI